MGPGRKICIVPYGTETTKAVVEGLLMDSWRALSDLKVTKFKAGKLMCPRTSLTWRQENCSKWTLSWAPTVGENRIVYAVVIDKYQLKNQLNASGKTTR